MKTIVRAILVFIMLLSAGSFSSAQAGCAEDFQTPPLFLSGEVPPLVMLVMERDHKLYYEAYNDAADLDEDGQLEIGYKPSIDYYGYFDCYKCYDYSTSSTRFEPASETSDKKCSGSWSGNFLNYVTMSRMDTMRKVLYGGYRSTDTATETVLERVFIPQDGHTWGKEYSSIADDGYDIREYTPLSLPVTGSRHIFANVSLSNTGVPLMRVLENSALRVWEWVSIEQPVACEMVTALHSSTGCPNSSSHSGTRTKVWDNGPQTSTTDKTTTGTAGTSSDNAPGSTTTSDNFDDASLDTTIWTWVDNDGTSPSGSSSYSETGGELVIKAEGADVWTSPNDKFCSVYMNDVSGGFTATVKITAQQTGVDAWGKCGIMVRNNMTQPGSSKGYCIMATTPGHGYSFQYDGGTVDGYLDTRLPSSDTDLVSLPAWLKLTKAGTLFTGYYSTDGTNWTKAGSATISSALTIQDVGLFVSSHKDNTYSTCKFDDFSITTTASTSPTLAFNDNNNDNWVLCTSPSSASPALLQFQFTTAKKILIYTLTCADGSITAADPYDWTFEASNDGVTWTTLDTRTGETFADADSSRPQKKTYTCATAPTEDYYYYRLNITETRDSTSSCVQLAEVELLDQLNIPTSATLTDYTVRVKVCDSTMPEASAKKYPAGNYKPIGILQRHGENNRMYFGLMTGSYTKNLDGGVLRKNIGSIKDEINADTGEFKYMDNSSIQGIVKSIDKLRIVGFNYGSSCTDANFKYNDNCGWITTRPITEGECRMWGNPIGEMMYETLRYFAGKSAATSDFTYSGTTDDSTLGLPTPSWKNPYSDTKNYCAKPFMLVLSDVAPSYDSDKVPGSPAWSTPVSQSAYTGDLSGVDVQTLANTISANEGISGDYFIGQKGSDYTGSCSEKSITGFGDIRGLCPEDPTKQGAYYSSALSYWGRINDVNTATAKEQYVRTYSVALSAPLPKIEIPVGASIVNGRVVGGHLVTLVPFGKSVGGYSIDSTKGKFQPTNTIVDFYLELLQPAHGIFRINYEDVEQGADHDMDAIVTYEYQVLDASNQPVNETNLSDGVKVQITLTSAYAAGSIIQHMGYIISGTTKDGTYLEVRDYDTAAASDPDYFLDTPPNKPPSPDNASAWDDNTALPLQATRIFTPDPAGGTTAASLLNNPLWYAAKWGGFEDKNNNKKPDNETEWDENSDGVPDTYYYVTNPLRLEQQLNKSFADILKKAASGSAVSVLATKGEGEGTIVQAYFKQSVTDDTGIHDASWIGYLQSLWVDPYGNIREDSNENGAYEIQLDKIIEFYQDDVGDTKVKRYPIGTDPYSKSGTPESISLEEVLPIWEAGKRLWQRDADDRQIYTYTGTGLIEFTTANASTLKPFLDVGDNTTCTDLGNTVDNRTTNVINFIRGIPDNSTDYLGSPKLRQRTLTFNGETHVWKLGDIVYSTPVSIAKPVENYGLIYDDTSYKQYLTSYKSRETIVYAGANDGMLHAFSSGLFDDNATVKQFNPYSTPALGDELWAYIPQCQLPHLKMLASLSYAGSNHLNFVDLKPRVFDAKIFTSSSVHPNGWGTILVCGMNLGGKSITVNDASFTGGAKTFVSSYAAFDITVPNSPVFLWEKNFPNMGFTTTTPAVVKVKNSWFLVVGSGPTSEDGTSTQNGRVFIINLSTGALLQTFVTTETNAFMNSPVSLDKNMTFSVAAIYVGASYQSGGSWLGTAYKIAVPQLNTSGEYDPSCLDCYDDNPVNWKWMPLFTSPAPFYAPFTLSVDQQDNAWIFMGTGRYISSADRISGDQQYLFGIKDPFYNRRGTAVGGYTPGCYNDYDATGCTLTMTDIFDANPYNVSAGGSIEIKSGSTDTLGLEEKTFDEFLSQGVKKMSTGTNPMEVYQGWFRKLPVPPDSCPCVCTDISCTSSSPCLTDLSCPAPCSRSTCTSSERVVNKPAAYGGIALFPTFTPTSDLCLYGGSSKLYGLYFESGTAYKKKVYTQADNSDTIQDVISLGAGLASSPAIHAGKEQGQAGTAISQLSTGQIVQIEVVPAFTVKSGTQYWREGR